MIRPDVLQTLSDFPHLIIKVADLASVSKLRLTSVDRKFQKCTSHIFICPGTAFEISLLYQLYFLA